MKTNKNQYLMEMEIPRWHDGESYNTIVLVEAETIKAATAIAEAKLQCKCSGSPTWKPNLLRYTDLSTWKGREFVNFGDVAAVPREPVVCPCCKKECVRKRNAVNVKCPNCGCTWNPEKEAEE